jgi:hypothetical protein
VVQLHSALRFLPLPLCRYRRCLKPLLAVSVACDIHRMHLERPAVFLDAQQSPPALQQTERGITIAVTHPLR